MFMSTYFCIGVFAFWPFLAWQHTVCYSVSQVALIYSHYDFEVDLTKFVCARINRLCYSLIYSLNGIFFGKYKKKKPLGKYKKKETAISYEIYMGRTDSNGNTFDVQLRWIDHFNWNELKQMLTTLTFQYFIYAL